MNSYEKQIKELYANRVSELEKEGLTTSDAQAAADAEFEREEKGTHTPGPWHVGKWREFPVEPHGKLTARYLTVNTPTRAPEIQPDGPIVCQVTYHPDESEGNARLIAAAPDLLAALTSLVGFDGKYANGEKMDSTDHKFNRDGLLKFAAAAIAKAEGGK